jgi:hypothetical protein
LPSARFTANADVSPTGLRAGLPGTWVIKYHIKDMVTFSMLAQDTSRTWNRRRPRWSHWCTCPLPRWGPAQHHQHTDLGVGEHHQGQLDGSGECCVLGAACVAGGVSGGGQYQPGDGVGRGGPQPPGQCQTDMRLLVGLYRCTDLPGQFSGRRGCSEQLEKVGITREAGAGILSQSR